VFETKSGQDDRSNGAALAIFATSAAAQPFHDDELGGGRTRTTI
jgi:hypothetical protein